MKKNLTALLLINMLFWMLATPSFAAWSGFKVLQDGLGATSVCPFTLANATGKQLAGIQVDIYTDSACANNAGANIWSNGDAAVHNGTWSLSNQALTGYSACTNIQSIKITLATLNGGLSNGLCMPTTCSSGTYTCTAPGTVVMAA